jgi:HEPN domain-containing protein
LTKDEHIKYWIDSAELDKKAAFNLFNSSYYVHSAFLFHLVLEKIIKAIWVKFSETNEPPKTHNLVYLLSKCKVFLDKEMLFKLARFNDFQIEARYPDYKKEIYERLTLDYAKLVKKDFEELEKCLIKLLQ